ncbi:MAG: hypothetical protein WBA44_09635 [Mesorhizobium sp.]
MNAHSPIVAAVPVFPVVYAMRLNLNGSHPVGYEDGDLVLINTLEEPKAGDLVCVHTKRSGAVMMVLEMGLGPGTWERMPFKERPDSTVHALLVGKVLGTDRILTIECQDLWAVHKCDGKADPADCATGAA